MIQSDTYRQFKIYYFLLFVFLFEFFVSFLRVNLNFCDLPPVTATAVLLTVDAKESPWGCGLFCKFFKNSLNLAVGIILKYASSSV
jgi:hypothetical protein